jgi:hypothetical protein
MAEIRCAGEAQMRRDAERLATSLGARLRFRLAFLPDC